MEFISSLSIFSSFYNSFSTAEMGLVASLLVISIWILYNSKGLSSKFSKQHWVLFALLFLASVVASFYGGIILGFPNGIVWMMFSLLFWVIAAKTLGAIPLLIIAATSGLIIGSFTTHNLLTPLIYAVSGVALAWAINQNYRSSIFKILRKPFIAIFLISIGFAFLTMGAMLLQAPSINSKIISLSINILPFSFLGFLFSAILGEILFHITKRYFEKYIKNEKPINVFPTEKKLHQKLLLGTLAASFLFFVIILLGGWGIVRNNSLKYFRNEVETATDSIAENFPLGVIFGQNLLDNIIQKYDLTDTPSEQLGLLFAEEFRITPFFQQMYLVNLRGNVEGGFPLRNQQGLEITNLTSIGVTKAIDLNISDSQTIFLSPENDPGNTEIVFLTPVSNRQGIVEYILVGKTNLFGNLFFLPSLNLINQLNQNIGTSNLIDSQGKILYSTTGESKKINITNLTDHSWFDIEDNILPNSNYLSKVDENLFLYTSIQLDKVFTYSLPIIGQFSLIFIVLIIIGYLFVRQGLSNFLIFVSQIKLDANRIAQGSVNSKLFYNRADELGELGQALESMRVSLRSNMQEASNILSVSQGVASSMALENAIPPILEGALAQGGDTARLVIMPDALGEDGIENTTNFGLPQPPKDYSEFDDILLSLTEKKQILVLNNPAKSPLKSISKQSPPGAVISIALMEKKKFLGILWIAYVNPHQITSKQEKYLKNIASQASIAITIAKRYLTIQRDEESLSSIFESTQLPVLVTNELLDIQYINPPAAQLFGKKLAKETRITKDLIPYPLWEILSSNDNKEFSKEVHFPNNQTYLVNISPIITSKRNNTFVCIFCNISPLINSSNRKSEMITTVSHGIRNPLLSIQGGATMIGKFGELNDTQKKYLDKIIEETKIANHFVEELLDPNRFADNNGMKIQPFSLTEVVKTLFEDFDRQAKSKKISFSSSIPSDDIIVEGDRLLVQQAIYNLIDNSIIYSENKGKVEISLAVDKSKAVIKIEDKGKGISPIDKQKLFEKENGFHPTGIMISKSIFEQHHGELEMKSDLGKGSTFKLSIPLRQS